MTTPNLDALNDLFTGMDDDFDPNAGFNPRPLLGKGRYMLKRYFVKPTTNAGNIIAVELAVVAPPAGATGLGSKVWDEVSLAFFISKVGKGLKYEKARCRDFTAALLGIAKGTDTGPQSKSLCAPHNPGCGILIDITASQNGQYTNYAFEHVAGQSPETIKACKDKLANSAASQSAPPAYPGVPHAAAGPVPANVPVAQPVAAPAPVASPNPLAGLFT